MLNSTINKSESKVVAITQVVEKSITPDKVTEMYDKVREQVEKDILRTVIVSDNKLNGIVMEMRDEHITAQKKFFYRFTLNGKEYVDSETYSSETVYTESDLVEKLFKRFKEVLGCDLAKESSRLIINKRS